MILYGLINMINTKYIHFISCFIILMMCIAVGGCRQAVSGIQKTLLLVDSALRFDADTLAFEMLDAIGEAEIAGMCDADVALYAVLVNQALDRMDYATDDSLARLAVNYYQTHDVDDDYHEGLAYYYMGHSLRNNNNLISREWYKEAVRYLGDNERYRFLSLYYRANGEYMSDDIGNSIHTFRESLSWALLTQNRWYISRAWAGLVACYANSQKLDSALVCADSVSKYVTDVSTKSYLYNSLSRAYINNGQYDMAKLYCDSAREIQNDTAEINLLMIDILMGKKDYIRAKKRLMGAVPVDMVDKAVYAEDLSNIYMEMHVYDSAKYYSALQLEYRDSLYHFDLHNIQRKSDMPHKVSILKEEGNHYLIHVVVIIVLAIMTAIVINIKRAKVKENEVSAIDVKSALRDINVKTNLLLSEAKVDDKLLRERFIEIVGEILPSAIDKIMSRVSQIDYDDAICLICYWAELPSSVACRIIMQSRGGAYKKLVKAKNKLQAKCGVSDMEKLVEEIFN